MIVNLNPLLYEFFFFFIFLNVSKIGSFCLTTHSRDARMKFVSAIITSNFFLHLMLMYASISKTILAPQRRCSFLESFAILRIATLQNLLPLFHPNTEIIIISTSSNLDLSIQL